MPEIAGLPELLRFADGRLVAAAKDWASRKKELLGLYSEYMYGYMPDPAEETLSWSLDEEKETGGALLHITVSAGQRRASFSVLAGLPVSIEARTPFPCFIEYRPWHVQDRATKEWKTGFSDLGYSASVWGGERWHEMELILPDEGHEKTARADLVQE